MTADATKRWYRCAIPYAEVMRSLFAACFLLLLTALAPAAGQTTIHRCVGANGGPVFTDQPCMALDATPLERSPASAPRMAPPAPVMLCAANARQLKRVVIEAFAEHDANRLAGVMLWGGYGASAAVADIRALQRTMRERLLGLNTEPASDADSAAAGSSSTSIAEEAPAPTAMVVDTRSGDGAEALHSLRFEIVRRAGCLWLRSTGGAGEEGLR